MVEITKDDLLDRRRIRQRKKAAEISETEESRLHRLFLGLAALITALSFGISFGDGGSNQPVYLISGMRLLHPDLLANDWWAMQTSHYHEAFAYLTAGLSALNILPWGLAIGNIASVLLVLLLLYQLLFALDPRHAASAWLMIVVLFFCIDGTRSVALTYFFSPSLQPSTVSTVFFFAAMVFYVKKRFLTSGAFLGLASLFHSNFLMLGFPFFGLAHLFQGRSRLVRRGFSQFVFATFVLAIQMPGILHVSGFDLPREVQSQANRIMIDIAAPFHYKPTMYLANFAGLCGWCLIALIQMKSFLRNEYDRRLCGLFVSSLLMIVTATVLTTVVFIDSVSRLFVWRLAPFCLLIAYMVVARSVIGVFASKGSNRASLSWWRLGGMSVGFALVVLSLIQNQLIFTVRGHLAKPSAALILLGFGMVGVWNRSRWVGKRPRFTQRAWIGYGVGILLFAALCIAVRDDFSWNRYNLLRGTPASETELFQWATTTDPSSIFLVPPNFLDFRLFAKRAVVVEAKAVPFRPDEVVEWYERLRTICGENYSYSLKLMERGYSLMNRERLKRVSAKYQVDFVVAYRDTEIAGSGLPVAFENQVYKVLRVPIAIR